MELLISLLIVSVIWSLNLMVQSTALSSEGDKNAHWGRSLRKVGISLAILGIIIMVTSVALGLRNELMSFGISIGIASTGIAVQGEILIRGEAQFKAIGKQLKFWAWVLGGVTVLCIVAIIVVAVY